MSDIRLMKLAGLLTETKSKLKEAISKPFETIAPINTWEMDDFVKNPSSFDISKHYRFIGLKKRPSVLSSEDLEDALADCDRNIKLANTILQLAKKAKDQMKGLSSAAATISAGEKDYENIKLTPQNILDFLKSIFIDDKDNVKAIYEMYNAAVRKRNPQYTDLILTSPSDLVGRGRVRGKDDVIFEFKRQSGGQISEWALENSLFEFIKKDYPEVADLLLIQRRTWSASYKKNFTVRVKRSAMSSGPAINRAWRRIFIKYAEWIPE